MIKSDMKNKFILLLCMMENIILNKRFNNYINTIKMGKY